MRHDVFKVRAYCSTWHGSLFSRPRKIPSHGEAGRCLPTHLRVGWGCSHRLAIMKTVATSVRAHISVPVPAFDSFGLKFLLGVGLLGHMVVLCVTSRGTSKPRDVILSGLPLEGKRQACRNPLL